MKKGFAISASIFVAASLLSAGDHVKNKEQKESKIMRLASPFTNHAVLQRGRTIPVWGIAAPGTPIQIDFAGHTVSGKTDETGKFRLNLPACDAGGPYEMIVRGGEKKIHLTDLLVGEVWVGSGQSNMEWLLRNSDPGQLEEYFKENKDPSRIRVFEVPRDSWEYSTPERMRNFSATGAWFALSLSKKLNVPIGIMISAIGGTPIESWMEDPSRLIPEGSIRFLPESRTALKKETAASFLSQDTADWKTMPIPGCWISSGKEKHGVVWFRRTVELPGNWEGKELRLRTGGIDKMEITFFNGTEVGHTGEGLSQDYWAAARNYRIAGNLVKGGKNQIAFRVFSWINGGGFVGKPEEYRLELASDPSQFIELAGVWSLKGEIVFDSVLNPRTPGGLFEYWLYPMIPYGIRGVIWYQGEDNARDIPSALLYEEQMKQLVNRWRYHWKQGDFPFLISQIVDYGTPACFDEKAGLAYLRESQRLAVKSLRNSGMSVLLGTGKGECHALDKRSAGERLARIALAETYHISGIVPNGPVLREISQEGSSAVISFDDAEGLHFVKGAGSSFYVAGADRKFYPAQVEIKGNTVLLKSDRVSEIYAIRYAWAKWPTGDLLYNASGLPASPFRTDDWK